MDKVKFKSKLDIFLTFMLINFFCADAELCHTTYTRNNMGQKCEHNCGLWVLNEIIKKIYPENLRKIVGAL
jgi:hypothetical protein